MLFGLAHAGPFDKKPVDVAPADPVPAEAPSEVTGPKAPELWGELPVDIDELPTGLASLSAQGCNACHFEVHDAWESSPHSQAAHTEPFRSALESVDGSPLCASCHLPLSVQQQQLLVEYDGGALAEARLQPNPSWDATLASEGVTCAACHVRDGAVVSTRAAPNAPHPVSVSEDLDSATTCAACHQLTWPGASEPLYDTYGEWSRSKVAEVGIQCQDCHMPPKSGLVTAGRFAAHADHGVVADPARALTVQIDLDSPDIQRGEPTAVSLSLRNTGAGHSFPTGSPFSHIQVQVQVVAGDEVLSEPFVHDLRRVVEVDPPYTVGEDTRIPAGGEVTLKLELEVPQTAEAGPADVQVAFVRVDSAGTSEPLFERRIPVRLR
ncbi:MAG: hypothetical protein GY913_01485 [Proteobacteria bacterium]|nr:hypothetical protein [Pseudomonadota bacterium]MCP4915571.1 hypothetical protein [Pseudomonadota bacterium]